MTEPQLFPLVDIQPVANMRNAWIALSLRVKPTAGDMAGALQSVFLASDLLAAVAPLNCIVLLDSPSVIDDHLRAAMPPTRVSFAFDANALCDESERKRMLGLHGHGYRVCIEGPVPEGASVPAALRGVVWNCRESAPAGQLLAAVFGPHLAYGVDSGARMFECETAGFEMFSGAYPFHPLPSSEAGDGSSRKRLLTLLGLLASDGDTDDIEAVLKQDPALSYHLMKLANSAAFVHSVPLTSFCQAIGLLGRRQLQRWLQLLLYARQKPDGVPNPLLPLAALRAAQMEALVKLRGGGREDQELGFMTGVFSLLDHLFAMSMSEIVGALRLAPAAADALLSRAGPLGELLVLAEADAVSAETLDMAKIEPAQWWSTQLHAYHWAIQVSRNL